MSEINANIVVEPITLTVVQEDPGITVTPDSIQLNLFSQGFAPPGGQVGQLQYNANGAFLGGVANTNYANGNLTLGNIGNVKITGGANAYYLQTDGTGNLTWAAGTVNANTGNGTSVGANGQIQVGDGTGNFISAPGFTFDNVANIFATPGDAQITGNIISGNADLGNAATANFFLGDGGLLGNLPGGVFIANGNSNVYVYANGNVAATVAGNANVLLVTGTYVIVNDLYVKDTEIHLGNGAGQTSQQTSAIAIGDLAGANNQSQSAIAIGQQAAEQDQGSVSIAIGAIAGAVNQGNYSIAIGSDAANLNQKDNAIAIGLQAGGAGLGSIGQGANSVAIGAKAGFGQQDNTIVINATGNTLEGNTAANALYIKPLRVNTTGNLLFYNDITGEITFDVFVANTANFAEASNTANFANYANFAGNVTISTDFIRFGNNAGTSNQAGYSIAIGSSAAPNNQGNLSIALGYLSGNNQGINAVAIGSNSASNAQGNYAIAIGSNSAHSGSQGNYAIAIGNSAGRSQGNYAIAIGDRSGGEIAQGSNAIAIGLLAGGNAQNTGGISIGSFSGRIQQGNDAIAIGTQAAANLQKTGAIAIGLNAGRGSSALNEFQDQYSIAIGANSCLDNGQGQNAIAIGYQAGKSNSRNNSITIGSFALVGPTNSIVLNATGSNYSPSTANAFFVKPIRNVSNNNVLMYNATTGEISYDLLSNYTGNINASNVTASQFVVLSNDTAANIANITGVGGAMIAVNDQDYQPAYWSVTDSVWKYVSNRGNV